MDYNWEYPASQADWDGLWKLIRETKTMFKPQGRVVTMAYYPDRAQEAQMAKGKIHEHCDLIHMMSYDQRGRHSTWEFGKHCVDQVTLCSIAKIRSVIDLLDQFHGMF